jgi:hypothetical protein
MCIGYESVSMLGCREGVKRFWAGRAGFGSGQVVLGLELGKLIKDF